MRKFVVALSLAVAIAFPLLQGCAKKEAEAPKTEQAPAPAAPEGQAPAQGAPAQGGAAPAEQAVTPAAK